MSNVLEFYLRMKDMMSSGLVKVAQTAKQSFVQVEAGAKKVQAVSNAAFKSMTANIAGAKNQSGFLRNSIDELRAKLVQVNQVKFGTVLKSEFKQASAEARALERQIARLENRGKRAGFMGGLVRHAMPWLGTAALIMGGIHFAKSSVGAAMDFEKSKTIYRTLTGSNTRGDQLTEELRELKQKTIMGAAVYKNAETMLGFGVKTDKVVPTLKMMGDLSMGNADKLKRLSLAYSEVTAQGVLNGRRMLQFVNAGFNPLTEMSRTTGKSVAELSHMLHKGQISAAMLEKSFVTATSEGGRFYRMMDKVGETSVGRLRKLEGQWVNLKIQAGQAMTPMLNGLMTWGERLLSLVHSQEKVSDSLRAQRAEITGLVGAIMSINEGSATRKNMLQELLDKYPEFFKGLDAETAKNIDLANALARVNDEYGKRINKSVNKELHDEYQKYYKGASNRNEQFIIMKQLISQGKYDEAKIINDRNGGQGSIMNYQLNDQYKSKVLADLDRMLKNSGKEATRYKRLDDGVMASDNSAFIKDEMLPFLFAQRKKGTVLNSRQKMAAFEAEVKKLYAGIGYKDGRASNSLLAGYDFTTLKGMMSGATGKKASEIATEETKASNKISNDIVSGGPRVINIHGVKFSDKVELHVTNLKEGTAQIEEMFDEMLLRVLNSGAAVQGTN